MPILATGDAASSGQTLGTRNSEGKLATAAEASPDSPKFSNRLLHHESRVLPGFSHAFARGFSPFRCQTLLNSHSFLARGLLFLARCLLGFLPLGSPFSGGRIIWSSSFWQGLIMACPRTSTTQTTLPIAPSAWDVSVPTALPGRRFSGSPDVIRHVVFKNLPTSPRMLFKMCPK